MLNSVRQKLIAVGEFSIFGIDILKNMLVLPFYTAEIIKQVYFIGARSIYLVCLSGLSIGIVLSLQTIYILKRFGAVEYVAVVVGLSIVKELGPVITALMVAGRAGSGVCAEIGSMKVTRQIDAMRIMNINPNNFLLRSRIIAFFISNPILTFFSIVIGIAGGMFIAVSFGDISVSKYMITTTSSIKLINILEALVKSLVFAGLIGLVSTYLGFNIKGGTREVGIKTTDTVVASSLLIFLFDIILTRFF